MIETNSTVQTPKGEPTVLISATGNRPPDIHPNGDGPPSIEFMNTEPPVWLGKMLKWLFPVAAVLFVVLIAVPVFLQKWLWMRQLNYSVIFWTMFSARAGLTCSAFVFAFLFLWLNVRWAARNSLSLSVARSRGEATDAKLNAIAVTQHIATRGVVPIVGIVAAIFASGMYTKWDTYLRFRYGGAFDLADPIFGRDLGFYIFRLPWYELLQGSIAIVAFLAIVAVTVPYG